MRVRLLNIAAAILLLVVWLATPLLSVVHITMEEHTYCAAHDRLEEGGTHSSDPAELESTQSEAPVASAGQNGSESEHEQCALGDCFTLEKLSPSTKLLSSPTEAADVNIQRFTNISAGERIPLLTIAPKCSPPSLV